MSRPTTSLRVLLNALPHSKIRPLANTAWFPRLSFPATAPAVRSYATHRSSTSSSSSTSPDHKTAHPSRAEATSDLLNRLGSTASRSANESAGGQESVGPFPLGVGPSGRRKVWKRWSDLGLGGKLVRTTQQTGNLTVILVGGALFVILTVALTTELFATNSPSVLYSQAVDMIRASDALNPHLLPPLKFTHSPHSSSPVRGTPQIPHTFIQHPTSGREHLLLTFWVHGRGKDEPEPMGWIKRGWRSVESFGREGLRYAGLLSPSESSTDDDGTSVQSVSRAGKESQVQAQQQQQQTGTLGRWLGGFTNSLRSTAGGSSGSGRGSTSTRGLPPAGTYKIGEVRAEYVKNASGQFTLLSLIVDVPSSRATYPGRAVVFQSPEAQTEGLIGKVIR
ncbi:hypothetical protein CI109_100944 [Kwoniella shandongensis]|uniref:Mitochondrial import inner membrane translocase subunit Tim21 n=1 Tax=Kwoniella shandongensis TaxID=1734106 RepID=A0A5M6C4A7_9TREE|nr:uncharacterized protein CI109_001410 [Kwoniella shandongensis]KAA5530007.1 hypothetical protein CI109_001410 [Kwoniella shandongensis]